MIWKFGESLRKSYKNDEKVGKWDLRGEVIVIEIFFLILKMKNK